MYALKLSSLGQSRDLLSMEIKHYSSSNGADRVSMVFSWVLFCTSLHKGCVLQKIVLLHTKLYTSQNSVVHYFHSEHCFFNLQYKLLYLWSWFWRKLSDKHATRGQEAIASGMPRSGVLGPVHLLYMQYVATQQLFSRSHREQQVGPQENKGTERYQKLVSGDVFTLGWKFLSVL